MWNFDVKMSQPLLGAATGAIWKCSSAIFRKGGPPSSLCSGEERSDRINTESVVNLLVSLLEEQPEEVLVNVSGALCQIAKADLETNAPLIKKAEAIPPLMALLTRNNTVPKRFQTFIQAASKNKNLFEINEDLVALVGPFGKYDESDG